MNYPTIDAHLKDPNTGVFYEVKLHAIPNVGDLIDFWSYTDQADKYPPAKHYKVIAVVHKIFDVTDRVHPALEADKGSHFVKIFVVEEDHSLFYE